MKEDSSENTPRVHNLFPVSASSVTTAHKNVYLPFRSGNFAPFLKELDLMEADADSSLYGEAMRKSMEISHGMTRTKDYAMFYLLGTVICRRALAEEALIRVVN